MNAKRTPFYVRYTSETALVLGGGRETCVRAGGGPLRSGHVGPRDVFVIDYVYLTRLQTSGGWGPTLPVGHSHFSSASPFVYGTKGRVKGPGIHRHHYHPSSRVRL